MPMEKCCRVQWLEQDGYFTSSKDGDRELRGFFKVVPNLFVTVKYNARIKLIDQEDSKPCDN